MTMLRALISKELRQFLPVIIGLGALVLWSLLDTFILKPADGHSWAATFWLMSPDKGSAEAYGDGGQLSRSPVTANTAARARSLRSTAAPINSPSTIAAASSSSVLGGSGLPR